MKKKLVVVVFLLFLAACRGRKISLVVSTPVVSPSALPAIFSPTPRFVDYPTATLTSPASTPAQPDPGTATLALTPTSTQVKKMLVEIIGCNTSLDILHQMGEVTNAFPVLRNYTDKKLTNVCATLSASDEDRTHPDKTVCVAELPAGYQITLKLTVDTGSGKDTSIKINVTSNEGIHVDAMHSNCLDIGFPGWLPDKVNVLEPIP
jgi:hypothetical protein